jgi:hypothetical protein
MRLHLLVPALLATLPVAFGQSTFGLAGFGYSIPQAAITAAPGHILMFSITGLQTRLAAPLKHNGEPYPLELGGVSVLLVQNGRETAVPLFGVQQNTCSVPNCAVQTSITIQMPYELDTARRADAALVIRENGSTAGLIPVVPVHDSVHLIGDCDLVRTLVNTLLSLVEPCSVRVLNITANVDGRGPWVSAQSQPRSGDHLMMAAFGLGAADGAVTGKRTFKRPVPPNMFEMTAEFAPNAMPRRFIAGAGIQPITPYYIGLSDIGVYQIDFPAPVVPPSTAPCDGKKILSNVTITLAGPNSFDGVQLCIQ